MHNAGKWCHMGWVRFRRDNLAVDGGHVEESWSQYMTRLIADGSKCCTFYKLCTKVVNF